MLTRKFICLISTLLFACSTVFPQLNPTHSSLSWALGIDDSLSFRYRALSFGSGWSVSKIDISEFNSLNSSTLNATFRMSYEDIYSLKFNNPHGFINYRGIQFYGAKDISHTNNNLMDSDNFEYGLRLISGVGFNLGAYQIIPYTVGGIVRNSLKFENKDGTTFAKSLGGKNSEIGLMVKLPIPFGITMAYNNTIYNGKSSYLKKVAAGFIETGAMYSTKKIIHFFAGDSKYYPVWSFVGQSVIRLLFISLRREESNFPFEGNPIYSTNKFHLGFNYNFRL